MSDKHIHNIPTSHLKTSHCGPDLLCVPHSDNIRLQHLCDEEKPVCQLSGCLVEVSGRHSVWCVRRLVVGVLAHQAGHLHS